MKLEITNDKIVLDGKTYALVETQGPEVELEGRWKDNLGGYLYFMERQMGKVRIHSDGELYFVGCHPRHNETLLKDSLKIIQFYNAHGRLPRV